MKKFFSIIIFFVCICVYVGNIYAQDTTTISNEKKALTTHRAGLTLMGVGVLLQVTGILVGIESNRYYVEAYAARQDWEEADRTGSTNGSTNKNILGDRFDERARVYNNFLISSAVVLGVGFLTTIAGAVLTIRTQSAVFSGSSATQSASFIQSFSHIPVVSDNIYVFSYGHQFGVRIR